MAGGARNDDRIKGPLLGPAVVAVRVSTRDLLVPLPLERLLGSLMKSLDDLDRVNVRCQVRQNRSLVSRARADLQYLRIRLQLR